MILAWCGIVWSQPQATPQADARVGEWLARLHASSLSRVPATGHSSSGKSRAKRTGKPPTGRPRKATAAERSPSKQKIKSRWRRNVADRWVIHWRTQDRLPWTEIVARDGRSERVLRKVVADYMENVEEGDFVRPLERDPVELIEGLLSELMVMRDTMVAVVQSEEQAAVVVAAAREWRRLVKEVRELLQAAGLLPRDLGRLRTLLEARQLSDMLDHTLDELEAGTVSPAQVRARVCGWAGVEPPMIEGSSSAPAVA